VFQIFPILTAIFLSKEVDQRGLDKMKGFGEELKGLVKNIKKLFKIKLILLYFLARFLINFLTLQIGNYEDKFKTNVLDFS
jgi:hypothetical protein